MDSSVLGALFASIAALAIVGAVIYILLVIAEWKIFEKAGEAGWKSIIPVYNTYILYKISWDVKYFWIMIGAAAVSAIGQNLGNTFGNILTYVTGVLMLVITIMQLNKLAKSFGHGAGFTLGLLFLPNVFTLILGFGSDEYQGPK